MNLLDIAEEGLLKQWWNSYNDHHPKVGHSASSYVKCPRQQVYEWIEAQPTNVVVKHAWAPAFGNIHHDLLYKLWVLGGASVLTEEELSFEYHTGELEYPVRGRPDAVITKDSEARMTDVKSVNPSAFRYELPKEDAIAQVSFYKRMVEEEVITCPSIDSYSITYVSRADFNRREYVMGEGFEEMDTTDYSAWELVEHCMKDQELPDRIGPDDKFPCATVFKKTGEKTTWCDYYDLCWEIHKHI